jgi:DnaJ-class molecular chaperone
MGNSTDTTFQQLLNEISSFFSRQSPTSRASETVSQPHRTAKQSAAEIATPSVDDIGRSGNRRPRRGDDLRYSMEISRQEARSGKKAQLQITRDSVTKTFLVTIPPGTKDGTKLRLAGKGGAGVDGGQPGDLFLYLLIQHSAVQTVDGELYCEVRIIPEIAELGGVIEVPTRRGIEWLTVSPGTKSAHISILGGRGKNQRVKIIIAESAQLKGFSRLFKR